MKNTASTLLFFFALVLVTQLLASNLALAQIDLGPDRFECVGQGVLLDAGQGYDSYTWSNGHDQAQLLVEIAGTYWVRATRGGQTFADTVVVAFYPFSRGRANIWYFGYGAGIDFNQRPPAALFDGKTFHYEGVATISTDQGELLFYTDGMTVWTREQQPMPNGIGLLGDFSSTQSGVVVPQPGNDSIYFLFTVDSEARRNGLRYSVINMSKNNGLGDVVLKNAPLFAPAAEKITAVRHANNHHIWVVAHYWNSSDFAVFRVDDFGFDPVPRVFTAGSPHLGNDPMFNRDSHGYLKSNPEGTLLASALQASNVVDIIRFDKNDGTIEEGFTLDLGQGCGPYGVEFSPDGRLLYASCITEGSVFQFDLASQDSATVQQSMTRVGYSPLREPGALQLAPDGKIYMARHFSNFIGTIENPNQLGRECQFDFDGFRTAQPSGGFNRSAIGLPNFIQSYFFFPDISFGQVCLGDTTHFSITNAFNIDSVQWSFGLEGVERIGFETSLLFDTAGTYPVQAILYQSCQVDTVRKKIEISPLPLPDLGADTLICHGQSITLDPGVFETYTWTPAGSPRAGAALTTGEAGVYLVEVSSGSGCFNSDTVVINVTEPIEIHFDITNGSCVQLGQGQIDATVAGGTGGISFVWETGSTETSLQNLTEGFYALTATDGHGCIRTDSAFVSENPILELIGYPISCFGANDGAIALRIQNATDPTTIAWSGGQSTDSISGLAKGFHRVTVTDFNGCSTTDSVQILEPNPLDITPYPQDPQCWNLANGVIDLNITGGTWPYTVLWSNGSTQPDQVGLTAGTYQVWVTDTLGCQGQDQATLSQPDTLVLELWVPEIACGEEGPALAWASGSGGMAPYGFRWSNGGLDTLAYLPVGTHKVSLIDQRGCQTDSVFEVVSNAITVQAELSEPSCNGLADGAISLLLAPGNTYEVLWDDGETTAVRAGLTAGTYGVSVTNDEGCSWQGSFQLLEPEELGLEIQELRPPACFGGADGLVVLKPSGGTPEHRFGWGNRPVGFENEIGNLSEFDNWAIVIDANGCRDSLWVEAELPEPLLLLPFSYLPPDCHGEATGTLTALATGGTGTLGYSLDDRPGQAEGFFVDVAAGEHRVRVKDQNGCGADQPFSMPQPGALVLQASILQVPDCELSTGVLEVEATGGSAPYLFRLDSEEIQAWNVFAGIAPGGHWVEVQDANRCMASLRFEMPALPDCQSLLEFPNVFSPDGDGVNDLLVPRHLRLATFEARIFNRWGDLLYVWNQADSGWDGSANGQPAAEGVYFLTASARGLDGQVWDLSKIVHLYR